MTYENSGGGRAGVIYLTELESWNPVLLLKCAIAVLSNARLDEISKLESILLNLHRITAYVHEN